MGRSQTAVIFGYPPKYVLIPLFMIFAAAALLIAGCNDDTIVDPGDGNGDIPDGPACSDSLPSVEILVPPSSASPVYPKKVPFVLSIGRHSTAAGLRYMLADMSVYFPYEEDIVGLLNEQPETFERFWSEWRAPGGELDSVIVGGNEPLARTHNYLFAVQVMDSCGRADSLFSLDKNAREFRVIDIYPTLSVAGSIIGTCNIRRYYYQADPLQVFNVQVPSGMLIDFAWGSPLTFDWMPPVEYRYGWDVVDPGNDDDWACDWSPLERQTAGAGIDAGVRALYIEARDASGAVTRAKIELETVHFQMDRNLLWVDDWLLGDPLPIRMLPGEEEHDEFWEGICSRAQGFDPLEDILPADEIYGDLGDSPLPLEELGLYRHVIWTYGNTPENAWRSTICFQPESNEVNGGFKPNTLAMYLAGGGSVLTCGRGDYNNSALAATFPLAPLMPASVLDDYPADGLSGAHPGIFTMAHDYYYVTAVDKVAGQFRTDLGVSRSLEHDALMMAVEAPAVLPYDLPDTLTLDESVTCNGCFFDPRTRGFTYVEVYDPWYYMAILEAGSHPCFTPLYLMRSRSSVSPLDHGVVALVTAIPWCDNKIGGDHESYHFGFPLWFMDHDKVVQITDEIFTSWGIR